MHKIEAGSCIFQERKKFKPDSELEQCRFYVRTTDFDNLVQLLVIAFGCVHDDHGTTTSH